VKVFAFLTVIFATAFSSYADYTLEDISPHFSTNTPMSANGNYNIYAEVDFASDDPVVSTPV
jgi:hypothetical protein